MVEIFTTPTCGYCNVAKEFFKSKGIDYTERDCSDKLVANEMMLLTGQMAVPVIRINGETIIGFNRPRIERLLSNL